MSNIKNRLIKMICIGIFGGCIYCLIEYLFRGYSHPTMFLLAFIVSQILMILNDTLFTHDDYFEIQVFFGAIVCIVFEWIFGIIFNSNFTIWDYRKLPLTIHEMNDQVNIIFCLAWLFICLWGIPLMDWIQYKLGLGFRPYYNSFITKKTYWL